MISEKACIKVKHILFLQKKTMHAVAPLKCTSRSASTSTVFFLKPGFHIVVIVVIHAGGDCRRLILVCDILQQESCFHIVVIVVIYILNHSHV